MRSKTRYNIRLAQRRDITVRRGDARYLPLFHRLLQETSARAGFGVHTLAYYTEAWRLFGPSDSVALLLAYHKESPLAALMVFARGETAWYLYGASSGQERQRMPTYILQWEAIRWAKAKGCHTYDLWGIPDLNADSIGKIADAEKHGALSRGMGGLYRFKRGFGGQERRYVGAYDYVYNGLPYRLLTAAWGWLGRRG
jgi:lipid II:glycine glycyltransferase (peptidoglycan interpeptide bridge formation enzyme)